MGDDQDTGTCISWLQTDMAEPSSSKTRVCHMANKRGCQPWINFLSREYRHLTDPPMFTSGVLQHLDVTNCPDTSKKKVNNSTHPQSGSHNEDGSPSLRPDYIHPRSGNSL
ncbi:PREDICTED: uncharacterized protein LOC104801833 isoform X3 [Tarenaya hassleriana]|uniref:uncharacterized protein LOC104801833 isoform X3 n=1 Tax=Tarenaya hassleriana TaxID=28532 RepID=UPI00053C521A|nr:PREDICTED: uncharacterized protein LOC104801833 isoform X3 [Tarenaya hassleriana]